MMSHSLINRFRKLRRDEDGSIAIETLMMVPLMAWVLVATLAFFDAYRADAISEKASLTVADLMSRETGYVTPELIDGTHELLKFLTINDNFPSLRMSVVRFIETNPLDDSNAGSYELVWTEQRGPAKPEMTTAMLQTMTDRLPLMSHNESLIVVETWSEYSSVYNIGLEDFTMNTYTFISPRFASQVCYNASPWAGQSTALC